jgi:hypothetical protein
MFFQNKISFHEKLHRETENRFRFSLGKEEQSCIHVKKDRIGINKIK